MGTPQAWHSTRYRPLFSVSFIYVQSWVILICFSEVMPLAIPLTYFFFLPPNKAFLFSHHPASYEVPTSSSEAVSGLLYTSLATNEEEVREEEDALTSLPKRKVALSLDDKWRLVKPLLTKYMLPLCEYGFLLDSSDYSDMTASFGIFGMCFNYLQLRLALTGACHDSSNTLSTRFVHYGLDLRPNYKLCCIRIIGHFPHSTLSCALAR